MSTRERHPVADAALGGVAVLLLGYVMAATSQPIQVCAPANETPAPTCRAVLTWPDE